MRLIVIVLIFLFFLVPSYSQSVQTETNNVSIVPADTQAISLYKRLMNHSFDLINGREYSVYSDIHRSNPFFKSATDATGTIFYHGRIYTDLHLLYDIYKDELILNYLNSDGYLKLISLNMQCIDSFLIITNNEPVMFQTVVFPGNAELKNGYYETAFKGRTSLLIKHIKEKEKKEGYDNYNYTVQRYLCINGTYSRIRSLLKFVKLFGDKNTLMKKYIASIHVGPFRKISDADLVRILRYYETI